MDDKVKTRKIEEYGFKMYPKPRPRHGGGVAIVYKSNIELQLNNRVKKFRTFEVLETMLHADQGRTRETHKRLQTTLLQEEPLHCQHVLD